MGRIARSHLPGTVFHLTARTQGREPWFTPVVRDRITEYIDAAFARCDATLLAYAVMPNHVHLVARQGFQPLWRFMQPLLRRTALLVQRTHGVEGHIFERRFADRACHDAEYARNGIVYTHLNPFRAGIVERPEDYRWSSHCAYSGQAADAKGGVPALRADLGLRLFGPRRDHTASLPRAYLRWVDWRIACDAVTADRRAGRQATTEPPLRRVAGGDAAWSTHFGPLPQPPAGTAAAPPDLQTLARQELERRAPDVPLELVRSACKVREVVAVRRAMIRSMDAAGYSGAAIARYLRITNQSVSMSLRGPGAAN